MYTQLIFTLQNGETVIFYADELIYLADAITEEALNNLDDNTVPLPNYEAQDRELNNIFRGLTYGVANILGSTYDVKPEYIVDLLDNARANNVLGIIQYRDLLEHIKQQDKRNISIPLEQLIILPMPLMSMQNINQWLFIAKHLSEHYLDQDHLSGWWFNIGDRVVRIRNDAKNGELPQQNKQFYSADHGTLSDIRTHTAENIRQSISSYTWEPDGTYFRAYYFWRFFTLSYLEQNRRLFVEQIQENDLRDHIKCKNILLSPSRTKVLPPLDLTHLSEEKIKEITEIHYKTNNKLIFSAGKGGGPEQELEWIKKKFILAYSNNSDLDPCTLLQRLTDDCFSTDAPTPYDKIPDNIKQNRNRAFDRTLNELRELHQGNIREEFIAYMNDEIANSPEQSLLLLLSLAFAYQYEAMRGITDERQWQDIHPNALGSRRIILTPEEAEEKKDSELTEEQRARYHSIFETLLEQFRYITQAIATLHAKLNLSVFYTQVRAIMHKETANQFILSQTLLELAKAINHGSHEPLFRELRAYGNRDSGDSYHKFADAIAAYQENETALTDPELAQKMREILSGKPLEDENLAFLPCLVAAWFISESARNQLTTMTSLMLLDLIEQNHYSLQHALIHPQKGTNVNRVRDAYGAKVNIDALGGYHPMAHAGSFHQTKELPDRGIKLPIARQKEAHLMIHWLYERINLLSDTVKNAFEIQNIEMRSSKEIPPKEERRPLEERINQKIKKSEKQKKTIRAKQSKQEDADTQKEEAKIDQLEREIDELTQKQRIKRELIARLLKIRLGSLQNLLPHTTINTSPLEHKSDEEIEIDTEEHQIALAKSASRREAEENGRFGPRAIPGWTLHDVNDEGHCFYEAVIHQMTLIGHEFLNTTGDEAPHMTLRNRIQVDNRDDETAWADVNEILNAASELNLIIAIVDTRDDTQTFVYYFRDVEGEFHHTTNINVTDLPHQPVIRLAYTGNHYLSVVRTATENQAILQQTNNTLATNPTLFGNSEQKSSNDTPPSSSPKPG